MRKDRGKVLTLETGAASTLLSEGANPIRIGGRMISNALLFLGFVLMIIPTWMINSLISKEEDKSPSNLLRWFLGKPREQNPLIPIIRAFQIWGGLWVICGMVLRVFNETFFDGPRGTLIYAFVFLLPVVLMTVAGSINKNREGG